MTGPTLDVLSYLKKAISQAKRTRRKDMLLGVKDCGSGNHWREQSEGDREKGWGQRVMFKEKQDKNLKKLIPLKVFLCSYRWTLPTLKSVLY